MPSRTGVESAEVVVIGGGPAGAAAAILLARLGRDCRLLEQSLPGSPKLCGEFLSPEAAPVLRALGLEGMLDEAGAVPVLGVRVRTAGRAVWEAALPAAGWGLSRSRLDEALLAQASREGVRVTRGARVHRAEERPDGPASIEGTAPDGAFRLRARAGLIATGKASPLTADRHPRRGRHVAFQAHFEGPSLGPSVELHAFRGGYVGRIDVENGRSNLCMLVSSRGRRPLPDEVLAQAGARDPDLAAWLARSRRVERWSSTPRLEYRRFAPAPAGGLLRIGDAAGAIAPLSGDGQAMALRSAELIVPLFYDRVRGRLSPAASRAFWTQIWSGEFASRIRTARLLHGLIVHPALVGTALLVLRGLPALGRAAVRRTRGETIPAGEGPARHRAHP